MSFRPSSRDFGDSSGRAVSRSGQKRILRSSDCSFFVHLWLSVARKLYRDQSRPHHDQVK
jgi:hypothetical protein